MTTIPDNLRLALTTCTVNTVSYDSDHAVKEFSPVTSSLLFSSYTKEQLQEFQAKDKAIRRLKYYLSLKRKSAAQKRTNECSELTLLLRHWNKLREENGLLYKDNNHGVSRQLLLPKVLRREV